MQRSVCTPLGKGTPVPAGRGKSWSHLSLCLGVYPAGQGHSCACGKGEIMVPSESLSLCIPRWARALLCLREGGNYGPI
ncbi:hypothetical protein DPMN_062966 [Dreissena polymorpha]|uniref:Uncharacterized protein n=1 Tax=Dreissena polymorpha TaxID=45954 RepID=A0A9D4CAR4_DREPO|nr:hypothetical protein DPMN_062966 [Dreissena polymorpha]